MAKTLSPLDANVIISEVAREATGQNIFGTVTTDDFVSVGETLLTQVPMENTLNALGVVMGRLIAASRPYQGKLRLIDAVDEGRFTQRKRKVSFYARDPEAAGDWNTQLNTNLADGYDNGTNGGSSAPSMWLQKPGMPVEVDFYSHNVWQDRLTFYPEQLKIAFRDQSEFLKLINGITQEKANDIEQQREANRRITLLNYMAGLYDCNQNVQAIDLVSAYNTKYNISPALTRADLLSPTYFKSFLEFFVSTVKQLSNMMEYRSVNHHWSMQKTVGGVTYDILRHTPKNRQKLIMYRPFWIDAETMIMPEIFNDQYLQVDNFEAVDYWQQIDSGAAIDVTPSVPDILGGTGLQIQGANVNLDYVVGVLFDEDACMDANIFDDALTSPLEAAKRYYNQIWHFNHGAINDFTEKGILLYMG